MNRGVKISVLVIATPLLLISLMVSLSFPQEQGTISAKSCIRTEHQRGPRVPEVFTDEMLSLDEVRERSPFWFRVPTSGNLPEDFSVQAAFFDDDGIAEYRGRNYRITRVELIFWDNEITNETKRTDVFGTALWIQITEAPGENSTDPYLRSPNKRIGHLWGYPSIIAENRIDVYKFDQQLSYRVGGCYWEDELMAVMESLVARG